MNDDEIAALFIPTYDDNPYHELLMEAFSETSVNPERSGSDLSLILPITRTVFYGHDGLDVVHLEWPQPFYYVKNYSGSHTIDKIVTFIRAIFFILDFTIVRLSSVQIAWTVHNKSDHENEHPVIEQIVNIILANASNQMFVKCCEAKEVISGLYRVNPNKISVVQDGNYIDAYPNNVSKKEARNQLSIAEDKFVYLFIGMIRPYKGVSELICSYKRASPRNAELWIVGSPATEQIQHQIDQRSQSCEDIRTVFKFIPSERMQMYINAADVIVLPYKDILNSGSVHLAMSFGKAVIAPGIGCIPETVSSENEMLYDPQHDDLDDVIKKVRTESGIEEIGNQNFQQSLNMTWEKHAKSVEEKYRNIINS